MNRLLTALAVALPFTLIPCPTFAASAPVWQPSLTVHQRTIDGEAVNYILVNPRNPHIHIEPAVANNRFGTTQTLAAIAKENHAIAAVNGTFFNSWSNQFPDGAIEMNGQFEYSAEGTLFGFGTGGKLTMVRAKEALSASIQDASNPISNLWPWYLNVESEAAKRIDIVTPYYGKSADANATDVVIGNGHVEQIANGPVPIPANDYAVELGGGESAMLKRIHVGDTATYHVTVEQLNGHPIDFSAYPNAIGAGPMLVRGGKVDLDPSLEGFHSGSLLDSVTLRTFVGWMPNGDVIMATIHAANVRTEAEIAHALGVAYAMNMDGGSSTGLYADGRYITTPGRALATALIVTYH